MNAAVVRSGGLTVAIAAVMVLAGNAQDINDYSGFIERKAFHTWSETPQLAGNAQSTTDFTETQTTVVRIERGHVTATYQVDYAYGVKSTRSGAFMDGRCPVSFMSTDEEIQYFPEQGVPARASVSFGRDEYSIGVQFGDNVVGVRTTRADRILVYNRGAKGCPDNDDKYYSDAKEFLRTVSGIRIDKQPLETNGAMAGSVITPVSTINAKPSRVETGWESIRWSLYRDGSKVCKPPSSEEQYWMNLQAEVMRLERERNAVARDISKATASTPASELNQLVAKRNELTRQLRELAEKNLGSPVFPITGKGMDAQAFASFGCGTKG